MYSGAMGNSLADKRTLGRFWLRVHFEARLREFIQGENPFSPVFHGP